ncbi:hypothetical protein PGTUg99_020534 [Puccinia graminis f. sp. tritici]|uniref:Secreted protein n=1 Tax=Puccinia graminis f. sp. tritici TaxID=56615 RepID=A0A5B0SIS8_PUCGR|nr:hypothetical protein PGTUg99_020534 [Puccinia graminis f. sp. tritici]
MFVLNSSLLVSSLINSSLLVASFSGTDPKSFLQGYFCSDLSNRFKQALCVHFCPYLNNQLNVAVIARKDHNL